MFYVWHTLLVASFIAVAYYLGVEHGKKIKWQKINQKQRNHTQKLD